MSHTPYRSPPSVTSLPSALSPPAKACHPRVIMQGIGLTAELCAELYLSGDFFGDILAILKPRDAISSPSY